MVLTKRKREERDGSIYSPAAHTILKKEREKAGDRGVAFREVYQIKMAEFCSEEESDYLILNIAILFPASPKSFVNLLAPTRFVVYFNGIPSDEREAKLISMISSVLEKIPVTRQLHLRRLRVYRKFSEDFNEFERFGNYGLWESWNNFIRRICSEILRDYPVIVHDLPQKYVTISFRT